MATYCLRTPISREDISKLKVNDVIYISGTVVTARDQAHKRALEYFQSGKLLPVNLEGLAVFHCGPVVKKKDAEWVVLAAGPTTSIRMEPFEADFIENFKVRVVVGKGGMGLNTTQAMVRHGCIYGAFTGGAAVLAAKSVKKVKDVKWLDLGVPEALWILEVEEFGPVVVAIDSYGCNLFLEVAREAEESKRQIYKKLGL